MTAHLTPATGTFFSVSRKKLLWSIEHMQTQRCTYLPDSPRGCDCKYGISPTSTPSGEQAGCPELRTVAKILRSLTDEQYDRLLLLAGGIHL